MGERDQQFVSIYQQYRCDDQRGWYERRRAELQAAYDQVSTVTGMLMFLTAAASLCAAQGLVGFPPWCSLLAVILPMLSTGLTAFDNLYAFDEQAKLYGDATNALLRARADAPNVQPRLDQPVDRDAIEAYVDQVEGILRREQGQWGQLASEIKSVEPATVTPRS